MNLNANLNYPQQDHRKLLAKEFLLDYAKLGEIYTEKIRWQYKLQNQSDRLGVANWVTRTVANILLTEPIRVTTANENCNRMIDNDFLGRLKFNSVFSKYLPYIFGIGDGILTVHRDNIGRPSINYIPIYNVLPIDFEGEECTKLVWYNTQKVGEDEYIIGVVESIGLREIKLWQVGQHRLITIEYGQPIWKKILGDTKPVLEKNELAIIPKWAWISTGIPNARWIGTPFHNSFIWPWWLINKIEWAWDLLQEELEASRKRIFVDKDLVKSSVDPYVKDPITGLVTRVKEFNWRSNIYEVVDLGTQEKIREYTPQVRLTEFENFFKFQMQTYCQIIGLGADFYSLYKSGNPVTATQIMLQKSDAYNTINQIKANLIAAVQTIVMALIDYWIEDGNLSEADRPESIYDIGVEFDDGVFVDSGKKLEEGIALYNAGLISQYTNLTRYANFSKADAIREIQMKQEEVMQQAQLEMQIQIQQAALMAELGMGGEENEENNKENKSKK